MKNQETKAKPKKSRKPIVTKKQVHKAHKIFSHTVKGTKSMRKKIHKWVGTGKVTL